MYNQDKTYHCTADGVVACYSDSKKHMFIPYESDHILQTQLYGNSHKGISYQNLEDNRYSYQQNKLYQEVVFGLNYKNDLSKLSFAEKIKIQVAHKKTQQLINLSKWKATAELIKSTFEKVFHDEVNTTFRTVSNFRQFITSTEVHPEDNEVINMNSLKTIGGKEAVINKMIEVGILPANFQNLKTA